MSVTLLLTSYHRLSPGQESQMTFGKVGGMIGRSSDCEWCLPDPEKIISGKHLKIIFQNERYYAIDNSTNGLFINRAVEPLGRGNRVELKEGLQLTFGDYEVVVGTLDGEPTGIAKQTSELKTPIPKPTKAYATSSIRNGSIGIQRPQNQLKKVQVKIDPAPEILGVKPRNSRQHIEKPALLEDSLLGQRNTQKAAPIFGESASFQGDEHFDPPVFIPGDWDSVLANPDEEPQYSSKDLNIESGQRTSALNSRESSVPKEIVNQQSMAYSRSNSVVKDNFSRERTSQRPQNQPTFVDPISDSQSQSYNKNDALNCFFAGMNVNPEAIRINSQQEFFEELGGVFRGMLQGMLDTLASRSSLKNEFRVLQTTIRPNENNPLKFSATVEDAMRNVFGNLGGSFLAPKEAVAEAFQDINRHQVALLSGTQGALIELLRYIQPKAIENRSQPARSVLDSLIPTAGKARCWDFYRDVYTDLMKDAEGESPKLFTNEFARAYEQQLKQFEQ